MYYIYGQSGPSLLIESTDSMIECTLLILHVRLIDGAHYLWWTIIQLHAASAEGFTLVLH